MRSRVKERANFCALVMAVLSGESIWLMISLARRLGWLGGMRFETLCSFNHEAEPIAVVVIVGSLLAIASRRTRPKPSESELEGRMKQSEAWK